MKSACINAFSDDPRTVEVREAPVPRPAAGQVRVRMKMAPVNPSDFNYMDGIYERSFARMIWNRGAERPTGAEALRALTPGGRMVCYGTLSREPISLPPRDIMMPMTSIEGFYLTAYLAKRTLLQRVGLVRKTAKLIASGVLGTPVEQTYRLDALHEALAHARRPGRAGKILLDLSEATEK